MTNYEREQENSRKGKTNYFRQKNSQTLQREANEGITYESSVGLNLDASKGKPLTHKLNLMFPQKNYQAELK